MVYPPFDTYPRQRLSFMSLVMLKRTLSIVLLSALATVPAWSADNKPMPSGNKLIALTFDDGPRPYVLYGVPDPQKVGRKEDHPIPGLLDLLDREKVHATFFVMGWRLTPKTWGDRRYETNIGITCTDAAKEALRRGHEIENHTYSHVELKTAERKKGEAWVVEDIMRGAAMVKTVTGSTPVYLRPPDWILPDDARKDIEKKGIKVLTISSENPMPLRDINSLDYLCAGAHPTQCPKPSLAQSVLKQIDAREKHGVFTHVLAFHELTSTTAQLPELIDALKGRGYRFVTVTEYMKALK
jgi:peptidoglycan-N-acetylglucosamine deacetylase